MRLGAYSMGFVPIEFEQYIELHVKNNPGVAAPEARTRLQAALDAYRAGRRCACGAPIWVIGSAEVGLSCFTCITGQADPSEDYELVEACEKGDA